MKFIKLIFKQKGFLAAEIEYWHLKLKYALGLTDEYLVFRPYHIYRMFSDDIKPLFPKGHEIYKNSSE